MREFLLNNKIRIVQVVLLLVVFFTAVAYINGRNIYMQKTKMLQERHFNTDIITK